MSDKRYLEWPFFDERHRELASRLDDWAREHVSQEHSSDVDAQCRELVQRAHACGKIHAKRP